MGRFQSQSIYIVVMEQIYLVDPPGASVCAALGALLMGKTMKVQNFIFAVMEDKMDSLLLVA